MLRFAVLGILVCFASSLTAQEQDDPAKLAELRAAVADAESKKGKESSEAALAAYQLGKHLLDRGSVAEGEVALDRSLAIHEKLKSPSSLNATLTRAQLARLYNATGRKDKAKAFEDKVRETLKDNRSFVGRQVLTMFAKPIPGTSPGTTAAPPTTAVAAAAPKAAPSSQAPATKS